MVKPFTAWLRRRFAPLLLVLCLIFVSFTSPAYAASADDPFVDGLKNGAGQAVAAAAVSGVICLGSAVFAPPSAPAVCVGAVETVAGWFGLKWMGGRWLFR